MARVPYKKRKRELERWLIGQELLEHFQKSSVLSAHTGGSQPSIAPAQGDLMPSSGILIQACAYIGTGTHTHTSKNKTLTERRKEKGKRGRLETLGDTGQSHMKAEVEMRNEMISQQWPGPPELLQAGKKAWNEFSLRKPGGPHPDDSLISDLLSFHPERCVLLL